MDGGRDGGFVGGRGVGGEGKLGMGVDGGTKGELRRKGVGAEKKGEMGTRGWRVRASPSRECKMVRQG